MIWLFLLLQTPNIDPPGPAHEASAQTMADITYYLASDELEGRGAGYDGERRAAEYIAGRFMELGLEPAFPLHEGDYGYIREFRFHALEAPMPWSVLTSRNVVGILPAAFPTSEYIVIGAHLDGQGMEGQALLGRELGGYQTVHAEPGDIVWNSAIDNAVSIAALVEIARLTRDRRSELRRNIVFIGFGAEENGLEGANDFVASPPESVGDVVALLNMEKVAGDPDADFLYVGSTTSPVFETIRQSMTSDIEMADFYPGIIANTDHYPFLLSNIPAVTIGTGSTFNDHRRTDHANLIDYDQLADRADYIAQYLLRLANYPGRIPFSADTRANLGVTGGPATPAEIAVRGSEADFAFKVTTVVTGSRGDRSGLRPGDLVFGLNDAPFPEGAMFQGLENTVAGLNADRVTFNVIRETGEIATLTLVP